MNGWTKGFLVGDPLALIGKAALRNFAMSTTRGLHLLAAQFEHVPLFSTEGRSVRVYLLVQTRMQLNHALVIQL